MISEGRFVGDGSWELHIYVTDLQVERVLRVKSDLHIGGVMLKLVEELGKTIDLSFSLIFFDSWYYYYYSLPIVIPIIIGMFCKHFLIPAHILISNLPLFMNFIPVFFLS